MRDAIDQHFADKGSYPASLDALVTDNYLRKIPEDPLTHSTESWQTVPAELRIPATRPPSLASTTSRAAHKERRWTGRTIRTGSQHSRQSSVGGRRSQSTVSVDSRRSQSTVSVDSRRSAVDGLASTAPHVSHGKK